MIDWNFVIAFVVAFVVLVSIYLFATSTVKKDE